MKIHTDVLTERDLHAARRVIPGTWLNSMRAGSRKRDHAFVVALRSDGTPDRNGTKRNRRPNTGTSTMSADEFAASYDDWGYWLAELFVLDPRMIAGPYKGRADFDFQTNDKYLPARATKGVS
jgi:hypothetical protein